MKSVRPYFARARNRALRRSARARHDAQRAPLARGIARFNALLARGTARFDALLARGTALFDALLARGTALFDGSFAFLAIAAALAGACDGSDPSASGMLDSGSSAAAAGDTAGGTSSGGASPGSAGAGVTTGALPSGAGATAAGPGAAAGGGAPGAVSPGGVITVMDAPCEKKVRTADKTVPDFMIVLDRSSSMRTMINADVRCTDPAMRPQACQGVDCTNARWMSTTACGGTMPAGVDRWAPAVEALKSLTAMFETKVSFGLTIYPGEGTGRNSECTTGTLRVPVGMNKAAPIAMALDGSSPGGYTPTSATLQGVLQQIQAKKASPDTSLPPQYILLVTDGSPNCVGQNAQNDQQAHQATIQAIDALAMAGVKTYVIGYDATVDQNLANQLTEYAQHGGTNNFFAVQDGPSLVSKFTEITSVAAECSYVLDKKPDDKRYVRVELDQETLPVDNQDGWSLSDKTVTISGAACARLRDGSKTHTLAVTVECAVIDIR
jgi:hypothetical protein